LPSAKRLQMGEEKSEMGASLGEMEGEATGRFVRGEA
jgi:hypothetical protein